MAKLTRAEMEEVIRGGGSVLMNDHAGVGQIYTTIASLPSEATLALGDEKRERIVADSLDAQIAALAAQKEQLDRARDERNASTKASAKDDKAGASDANETAVTAEDDVPGSASGAVVGAADSAGDPSGADDGGEDGHDKKSGAKSGTKRPGAK